MSDLGLEEEVAKDEEEQPTKKEKKKSLKLKIKDFFQNPKKRLIFIISLGLFLIIIFGIGFLLLTRDQKISTADETKQTKKETPVQETKYEAPLNGVMTDKASSEKHPLAIMVENHPDARPQAGLDKADVVYEAIAEGGITRFLAVFGTQEAEKVGPVRSARTYYVDWAHGYAAYLAHVGGNMDALEKIIAEKTLDLDQFRYSSSYWREGSNVATEHTMFTSTTKLREQAQKNGYSTVNNFTVYTYKDDPTEANQTALPESQKVTVNYSSSEYKVDFQYDKATNSYKRFMAGASHIDRVTRQQLNPKNIVVMTVQRKPTVTKINEQGYIMTTVGTGKAKFYIEGKEISGTWKKESASDREIFYDDAGKEIVFDRGQLWICVIPPEGSVSSQ